MSGTRGRVEDAVASAILTLGREITDHLRTMRPEIQPVLAAREAKMNSLNRLPVIRQIPERKGFVRGFSGRAEGANLFHALAGSAFRVSQAISGPRARTRVPNPPIAVAERLSGAGEVLNVVTFPRFRGLENDPVLLPSARRTGTACLGHGSG